MITYNFDLSNVDWDDLKATLKADDFDNGRTPAQYKTSFENSFAADRAKFFCGLKRQVSRNVLEDEC